MALKLKNSLSKTQQKNLQRRLSHFLRHHQQKNDLLLKDVAKKLDYTPPKFADLCRSDKPHGRFISSLDFLKSLADLEKLSIGQLVTFQTKQNKTIYLTHLKYKYFNVYL